MVQVMPGKSGKHKGRRPKSHSGKSGKPGKPGKHQPDCKRQHQHVVLPVTQVPSLHNPVSPHQTQSKTSNAIIAVTTFIHHVIQNSTKLEQTISDPMSPQCSLTAAGPHVMSASSQPAKQHFPPMHRHTCTLLCANSTRHSLLHFHSQVTTTLQLTGVHGRCSQLTGGHDWRA